MSNISQCLDLGVRQMLLCILILHGAQGRIQDYPGDAPDHHPGASEQIHHLRFLRLRLLLCSHLLRETSNAGHLF